MTEFYNYFKSMSFSSDANKIFNQVVADYHKSDDVDAQMKNPYQAGTIESVLYLKNWIDSV